MRTKWGETKQEVQGKFSGGGFGGTLAQARGELGAAVKLKNFMASQIAIMGMRPRQVRGNDKSHKKKKKNTQNYI